MKAELEPVESSLGLNVGTHSRNTSKAPSPSWSALAKRRELEGPASHGRNAKIENKSNSGKDERQLQQDADQITNSITRNLANAMSGKEARTSGMWQNIRIPSVRVIELMPADPRSWSRAPSQCWLIASPKMRR